MFDVDSWAYGKNKKYKTELKEPTKKSISVISGITENNGTNYYTEDDLSENEIFEDELTISTRGIYSGTVFYHEEKFVLANNILVMKMPNLTKKQKQFIGSLINSLQYGGYSGYPRKETLEQDKIQLPTKNGEIDFEFMENFIAELEAERIAELEAERIAELEAYLLSTGLKDYELTPKEQEILQDFENEKFEFGEFSLDKIFKIATGRDVIIGRVTSGDIPLISHQHYNNGITKNITLLSNRRLFDYKTTLPLADRGVFLATTQKNNFHIGTRVKALTFISGKKSLRERLFFVSSINKLQVLFTEYSENATDNLPNLKINLPTQNNEPNYDIMKTFISAIQKLVIKDVVLYADKKIKVTKSVVAK